MTNKTSKLLNEASGHLLNSEKINAIYTLIYVGEITSSQIEKGSKKKIQVGQREGEDESLSLCDFQGLPQIIVFKPLKKPYKIKRGEHGVDLIGNY